MKLKPTGAVAILGSLIEPLGQCLTQASARRIPVLRASPAAKRCVARLACKCDEGRLSPEERAEYQFYAGVGDFIALLQAKARRRLANAAPA